MAVWNIFGFGAGLFDFGAYVSGCPGPLCPGVVQEALALLGDLLPTLRLTVVGEAMSR